MITKKVCVDVKNQKKLMCTKKVYIWNPAMLNCKNDKCIGGITDDSVITCDEIYKR